MTAAFMTIDNETDEDVVLGKASPPDAGMVQLHEMAEADGTTGQRRRWTAVSRSRRTAAAAVPALAGYHVMPMDLTGEPGAGRRGGGAGLWSSPTAAPGGHRPREGVHRGGGITSLPGTEEHCTDGRVRAHSRRASAVPGVRRVGAAGGGCRLSRRRCLASARDPSRHPGSPDDVRGPSSAVMVPTSWIAAPRRGSPRSWPFDPLPHVDRDALGRLLRA